MTYAVEAIDLHKRFDTVHAIKGINLRIEQGEFFALLGPNGAGKSTLINLLAGLQRPSEGHLKVMGFHVVDEYQQARLRLGIVPQELVFDPFFTVREMLRFQSGYFGLGRKNDDWIDEIINTLDLSDKANVNMRKLSGGMKRRVLIAQALVHKPPVIVLDEPTAGVDVELRHTLWRFIQKLNREGHTIILTTHYLEEAENLCSRVALIKKGEIIDLDSTANLLKRYRFQKKIRLRFNDQLSQPIIDFPHTQEKENYFFSLDSFEDIAKLMQCVQSLNLSIIDMEIIQPDLESVFIERMKL